MTHEDMDLEDDFYASGNEGGGTRPGIGHNGGPQMDDGMV